MASSRGFETEVLAIKLLIVLVRLQTLFTEWCLAVVLLVSRWCLVACLERELGHLEAPFRSPLWAPSRPVTEELLTVTGNLGGGEAGKGLGA